MIIDVGITQKDIDRYDDPSLYEVYVQTYNDSYHSDESDEMYRDLENEVRNMSSRPRRLTDYYKSIDLYNRWMEHLYEIHGNKNIFKFKYKAGMIKEYVPAKPRLKSKFLRACAKKGILLSEMPLKKPKIDWKGLRDKFYEDRGIDPEEVVSKISYDTKPPSKKERKFVEKVLDDALNLTNIKSKSKKFKHSVYSSDIDIINEYISMRNGGESFGTGKKKGKKKSKKKHKEYKFRRMLTHYLSDDWEKNIESYEPKEDPVSDYNGILISQTDAKEMEIYKLMADNGWNTYKMMKRAGYSKRQIGMFSNKKKKKKKSKKRKKIDSQIGMVLDDMVIDLGYDSYDEFSEDMLDMSWAHVQDQYKGLV